MASPDILAAGRLFHNFRRFVETEDRIVDRLPLILEEGLQAPAHAKNGQVVRDFNIQVAGIEVAYDSVIFLHRYREEVSSLYLPYPGTSQVCLALDDTVPVKTVGEMEDGWPMLSQDEVYALEPIAPAHFTDIWIPETYLYETVAANALAKHGLAVHVL